MSVKQPGQCFVPAVLRTAMEAMASACDNVGVRIRMDPMVAALAHEDSQAQASSTSSSSVSSAIRYNSNISTPVAAGTPNSASKSDAIPNTLRQAASSGTRPSASSSTVQRPAARSQQPILLPPPSRALVLKEPVVPDKRHFLAKVSPEVGPP